MSKPFSAAEHLVKRIEELRVAEENLKAEGARVRRQAEAARGERERLEEKLAKSKAATK